MLRSFKEKLRHLAADPNDEFHTLIRKRVGKRATLILEKRLKQMILLMPGLLSKIHDSWKFSEGFSQTKKLSGFLLTYMYHPDDFLPEKTHGLFGYLDDAYFVVLVYEHLTQEKTQKGLDLDSTEQQFLHDLRFLKRAAKTVIPNEALKIEKILNELLNHRQETYLQMFQTKAVAA